MSSRLAAVILALVGCWVAVSECRTVVLQDNHVKSEQEGMPKVHVGADGVSASFGGYIASAGLGGQIGGSSGVASGGLYARAGTPDGKEAVAGLGGSLQPGHTEGALHAGASAGSSSTSIVNENQNQQGINNHKIRPGTTLYNDIFNIPTSILGAVNRLLNSGVNAVSNIGTVQGHAVVGGAATGGEVGTKSGAGAHAQIGVVSSGNGVRTSTTFFNDVFNIPITALNAVNQLLNNKNGK